MERHAEGPAPAQEATLLSGSKGGSSKGGGSGGRWAPCCVACKAWLITSGSRGSHRHAARHAGSRGRQHSRAPTASDPPGPCRWPCAAWTRLSVVGLPRNGVDRPESEVRNPALPARRSGPWGDLQLSCCRALSSDDHAAHTATVLHRSGAGPAAKVGARCSAVCAPRCFAQWLLHTPQPTQAHARSAPCTLLHLPPPTRRRHASASLAGLPPCTQWPVLLLGSQDTAGGDGSPPCRPVWLWRQGHREGAGEGGAVQVRNGRRHGSIK